MEYIICVNQDNINYWYSMDSIIAWTKFTSLATKFNDIDSLLYETLIIKEWFKDAVNTHIFIQKWS